MEQCKNAMFYSEVYIFADQQIFNFNLFHNAVHLSFTNSTLLNKPLNVKMMFSLTLQIHPELLHCDSCNLTKHLASQLFMCLFSLSKAHCKAHLNTTFLQAHCVNTFAHCFTELEPFWLNTLKQNKANLEKFLLW